MPISRPSICSATTAAAPAAGSAAAPGRGDGRIPPPARGRPGRTLAVLLPLLLALGGCDGGNDSSTAPASSTVEKEAVGGAETAHYVALGDSITSGAETPGTSYPAILSGLLGQPVVNAGRGGELTGGGLGRVGGLASRYRPATVLIMEGINEAHALNVSLDGAVANLRQMVQVVKANGGTPILATVTPDLVDPTRIERVSLLNAGIRGIASSEGVRLVDVYAAFNNNPQLLLPDLVHPNVAGTQLIAQKFHAALR